MTDPAELSPELRTLAFGVAYRMLGSASDAEDVAQETMLRTHTALRRGDQIDSPRAFVATVATRLSINVATSAHARRVSYVGEWLPEPILTDTAGDPEQQVEMADSLALAMLVLLESLSPKQRAALVLHDMFGYGYAEIAAIIGTNETSVRQLTVRAREQVRQRRPRFRSTREERDALARQVHAAAQAGDLAGLETLLAQDVRLTGDGGGKAPALARTVHGRARVAHALSNWVKLAGRTAGVTSRLVEVNGGPGVLYVDGEDRVVSVLVLDLVDGQIASVNAIVNPDKLTRLGPVSDLWSRRPQFGLPAG